MSFQLRDPRSAYYDQSRQQLERGPYGNPKKGRVFPPSKYHGHEQKGHTHPAREIVMEPGMLFICHDCGNKDKTTDHFKYNCACWAARTRLAVGFAQIHEYGILQGHHYLSNEAVDVMIGQGCTLERVNIQHPDWLPHEPLYDRNTMTGTWETTGIVPLHLWNALNPLLRMPPTPQNLSVPERQRMGLSQRPITTMMSPRHHSLRNLEKQMEIEENAQAEQRDRVLPVFVNILLDTRNYQQRIARLESQIAVCKMTINAHATNGNLPNWVAADIHSDFDGVNHAEYIPASINRVAPNLPVPAVPLTNNQAAALFECNNLQSLPQHKRNLQLH